MRDLSDKAGELMLSGDARLGKVEGSHLPSTIS